MTSKYGQLGSDDFGSTPLAEQSRTSEAEFGLQIPLHCLPGILEQGMLLAVEGLLTWRSSGRFRGGLKAGMTNCVRAVALYRKCCRAVSPQEPPPALRGSRSRHSRPSPGLFKTRAITCPPTSHCKIKTCSLQQLDLIEGSQQDSHRRYLAGL